MFTRFQAICYYTRETLDSITLWDMTKAVGWTLLSILALACAILGASMTAPL